MPASSSRASQPCPGRLPVLEGRSGSPPAGLGAVRGADRSRRPRSPIRLRCLARFLPQLPARASSEDSAARRVRRPGFRGSPRSRGSPSPAPAASLPSPRPAHGPSPRAPGPSLPPYLSRPPPPPARSPVPVTLLGVYARSPPRAPRLCAPEPPGAPTPAPHSLAAADGAAAGPRAADP